MKYNCGRYKKRKKGKKMSYALFQKKTKDILGTENKLKKKRKKKKKREELWIIAEENEKGK